MKKLLLITLICILAAGLFAATTRAYSQKLWTSTTTDGQFPDVVNSSTTTNPNYRLTAYILSRPGEVSSTDPLLDTVGAAGAGLPSVIRVARFGNGTTQPYTTLAFVQFSVFTTQWQAGDVLHCVLTQLADNDVVTWDLTIPDNATSAMGYNQPINPIPLVNCSSMFAPPVYYVDVTSIPTGQPILVSGAATPHSTPHQFLLSEVLGLPIAINNPMFIWAPAQFIPVAGADQDVEFVGTPVTIPDPPIPQTPPNGAMGLPWGMVDLGWAPGQPPVPDSFFDIFLEISIDLPPVPGYSDFGPPVATVEFGMPLMFHPMGLLPNSHYYWYVKYDDGVGKGSSNSPIWEFYTGDYETPVELSSFTAVFAAGFYVELAWVVQSETNHLGYNVLRGDSNVLADATTLNVVPISSGSVSGTQISYNFRDEQIESNHTYYYWLESVDLNGMTHFFGPISVIVTNDIPEDPTPVIPTVTALLDAYPNPFNASNATTIRYNLKNSGSVKIEITNLKGQVVWSSTRTYDKAGAYQVTWNGKDLNGKPVASGIYYYRMTSGKYTAGKKIVLVK